MGTQHMPQRRKRRLKGGPERSNVTSHAALHVSLQLEPDGQGDPPHGLGSSVDVFRWVKPSGPHPVEYRLVTPVTESINDSGFGGCAAFIHAEGNEHASFNGRSARGHGVAERGSRRRWGYAVPRTGGRYRIRRCDGGG